MNLTLMSLEFTQRLAHQISAQNPYKYSSFSDQASFIDNLDKLVSKHDCKLWEKLEKKMKDEKKFLDKAEEGMATLE